jgi:hypothetical protein
VVAGQTARLPDLFATTDPGTVAVFGERVGGGRELQSAPAFPGELRLMGQTTDFAVVAGEPATLSVKAGGSGFAYQWYTGRKGDTSQPLPRARQATFTLPSVLRTATFWVRLTDGVTNLDSETITVTATEAGAGITATQSFVADPRPGLPVEIRAEVSFEVKGFSRDMVVMLQGFIVLFSGAMAYVLAPWIASVLGAVRRSPKEASGG